MIKDKFKKLEKVTTKVEGNIKKLTKGKQLRKPKLKIRKLSATRALLKGRDKTRLVQPKENMDVDNLMEAERITFLGRGNLL